MEIIKEFDQLKLIKTGRLVYFLQIILLNLVLILIAFAIFDKTKNGFIGTIIIAVMCIFVNLKNWKKYFDKNIILYKRDCFLYINGEQKRIEKSLFLQISKRLDSFIYEHTYDLTLVFKDKYYLLAFGIDVDEKNKLINQIDLLLGEKITCYERFIFF